MSEAALAPDPQFAFCTIREDEKLAVLRAEILQEYRLSEEANELLTPCYKTAIALVGGDQE